MNKKNYFILVLFLQSWIFFSVLLTTPIQSEKSTPQETSFSVKTSSNEAFPRILDETQVNYYTTSWQTYPSICALSSETFAVAWFSAGQDSASNGVYARVFDATTGNNITREFRVNHHSPSSQDAPSICALSSETFAVAWFSWQQDPDGSKGVYARVFDATTGNNITREFRVNHNTTSDQTFPSICALSSDKFVVVWESWQQDPDGTCGVYARVFDATTGNNITREFRVNHHIPDTQKLPSVCALSSNTFAVAWQSWQQDGNNDGVYARVFDATTGNNITRELQVNHYTPINQNNPSICKLTSNTFAVAWESLGQDPDASAGVYANVFNATTGNNITNEFRLNNHIINNQGEPSICKLTSDTFAVAWQSFGQDPDGSYGVYSSVFNATTGNNITREFRINHNTTSDQTYPSICALSSDTYAVAWQSFGQDEPGGFGVYVSVFGKYSTSLPGSGVAAGDDDDDDDDEFNILVVSVMIIGIVVVFGMMGIIIYLIKKKGR